MIGSTMDMWGRRGWDDFRPSGRLNLTGNVYGQHEWLKVMIDTHNFRFQDGSVMIRREKLWVAR